MQNIYITIFENHNVNHFINLKHDGNEISVIYTRVQILEVFFQYVFVDFFYIKEPQFTINEMKCLLTLENDLIAVRLFFNYSYIIHSDSSTRLLEFQRYRVYM